MACEPLITDPFVFPRRADNRPGLPRVAYRIGRYRDFLEAMERGIDAAPELAAWTHREPDDSGIALMQGAAILGDILTFYQEHYANEAWLRTAAWRESIAEKTRFRQRRLSKLRCIQVDGMRRHERPSPAAIARGRTTHRVQPLKRLRAHQASKVPGKCEAGRRWRRRLAC